MTTSNYIVSYQDTRPIEQKSKGRGNKIVVGTVVKAKIGELEEEVEGDHHQWDGDMPWWDGTQVSGAVPVALRSGVTPPEEERKGDRGGG